MFLAPLTPFQLERKDTYNRAVKGYFAEFKAPVSGCYTLSLHFDSAYNEAHIYSACSSYGSSYLIADCVPISLFKSGPSRGSLFVNAKSVDFFTGETIIPDSSYFLVGGSEPNLFIVSGFWELICTPVILPVDSYSSTTRPTSITGNYGIIGDDGKLVQVTGNIIVNETSNTYYNPATGETTPITNWSYDYSDRSYTVTKEDGDTTTITYGDENVTITEGDTVYNIYYIVSGDGEDPPSSCAHSWTETSRTDPTCTTPGQASYSCSKCGETKTETLKPTGHT